MISNLVALLGDMGEREALSWFCIFLIASSINSCTPVFTESKQKIYRMTYAYFFN